MPTELAWDRSGVCEWTTAHRPAFGDLHKVSLSPAPGGSDSAAAPWAWQECQSSLPSSTAPSSQHCRPTDVGCPTASTPPAPSTSTIRSPAQHHQGEDEKRDPDTGGSEVGGSWLGLALLLRPLGLGHAGGGPAAGEGTPRGQWVQRQQLETAGLEENPTKMKTRKADRELSKVTGYDSKKQNPVSFICIVKASREFDKRLFNVANE